MTGSHTNTMTLLLVCCCSPQDSSHYESIQRLRSQDALAQSGRTLMRDDHGKLSITDQGGDDGTGKRTVYSHLGSVWGSSKESVMHRDIRWSSS
jgi:hypothetical protein